MLLPVLNCPDMRFLAARWAGESSNSELPMEQEECSCNKTFLMPSSRADVFHSSKNTTEDQLWCLPLTGLGLGHCRGSFWQEMETDTEVYPFSLTPGTGLNIPQCKWWPCPREGLPTQNTQGTPAQALHPQCTPALPPHQHPPLPNSGRQAGGACRSPAVGKTVWSWAISFNELPINKLY